MKINPEALCEQKWKKYRSQNEKKDRRDLRKEVFLKQLENKFRRHREKEDRWLRRLDSVIELYLPHGMPEPEIDEMGKEYSLDFEQQTECKELKDFGNMEVPNFEEICISAEGSFEEQTRNTADFQKKEFHETFDKEPMNFENIQKAFKEIWYPEYEIIDELIYIKDLETFHSNVVNPCEKIYTEL
ncbi:hypothetical protein AVEN_41175-1 [Araneus ventricosus]|uniref:Uncharacterized protein n=1 Tax=Araneus ventricosus TaxID=182803 RepID=A0A4Y2R6Z6_ARAVE|nr:hypothetical protein AVEN_41175-1 [Araneus ventricosus]